MYVLALKGSDNKDVLFFVARGKSQIRRMLAQCAPSVDPSEAMITSLEEIGDAGVFFMENATDASRVGRGELYVGDADEENT